jgi:hypothetical protein
MRQFVALVFLWGCADRTEIVVGVATDLKARGQIDLVTFTALRGGAPIIDHQWDLSDKPAGRYELPGSFGLFSPDGSEVGVELQVKGFKGTTLVTERDSLLRLVQGRTLFMRMGIVGDCGNLSRPSCASSETCVEGVCRPTEIAGARLPNFRAELVDHVACDSGTQWAISSTGELMPPISPGAECAADEFCQEGTCLKLLANEDGSLGQALWTDVPSGTTLAMRAVWGTPDGQDVFSVGDRGTILHLSGGLPMAAGAFAAEMSGTTENLYAVWGTSAADVWAAGNGGTLLHRDASGWKSVASPTVARLEGLYALAPDDAWAVGRLDTMTPIVLHWAGAAWAKVALPRVDDLRAIWAAGPADVWAAGHHGNLVHWDGMAFSAATAPMGDYEGVGGYGSEVFAVGRQGLIVHNGMQEDSGVSVDLFHVFASAGGDVFAVGDYGVILHRENGAWVRQPARTDQPLFGVWGSIGGDLFASGRDGVLLHNTGVPAPCVVDNIAGTLCAGHYACADATNCRTTCATDTDCQDGYFCAPNGDCRARRAQGAYCDDIAGSDCKENGCRVCGTGFFCTDHVCCDQSPAACNGCMQCTAPSGTCAPRPFGATSAACEVMAGGCVQPVCNGAGGCGNTGDACGSACTGTPASVVLSECVSGMCTAASPMPCPSPYCGFGPTQNPNTCPINIEAGCTSDTNCLNTTTTHYCDGNFTCHLYRQKGEPCNPNSPKHCAAPPCNECAPGLTCADGVCCDAACTGQCQACDLPGKAGTCSTVTSGPPHGMRPACRGSGACEGFCDGTSASTCADSANECAAAVCGSADTLLQAATCSAAACPSPSPSPCAPFACAHGACLTHCAGNADCASTTPTCDVPTGTCH